MKRKRASAKEKLEQTKDLDMEAAWIKKGGQAPEEAHELRLRFMTRWKEKLPEHSMRLHSHPTRYYASLVGGDIGHTVAAFNEGAKATVIASMDHGKVAGYTVAFKTKNFKRVSQDEVDKMLGKKTGSEEEYYALQEAVCRKLGIKVRFLAMPGYRKEVGITGRVGFEKIKPKRRRN